MQDTTPVAPAPWDVVLDAVVWFHRASVGALIRYRETPVGPYHEVLFSPGVLPGTTIPFIAVDSEPSVQGGRENWTLPKTLARFDWPALAEGEDWSVRATVRARPRRFPVAGLVRTRQPIGVFFTRARGRARLGSVEVEARGATPLRSGRHPALILEGVRGVVGQPR